MARRRTGLVVALALVSTSAIAEGPYTSTAAFDDVRFELGNAVVTRGLLRRARLSVDRPTCSRGA